MQSKLGEHCREAVVELCRKMSPAERLQAFVNQSKVLAELYRAGEAARRAQRVTPQHSTAAQNS